MTTKITDICTTAFHALWLQDYGRVDLRLTHDNEVYVLEVNPNPFLASENEMADAAEKAGGHYVVRESDAHAWIEAWIPGRGWVEADPTPAGDYAALHAGRGNVVERGTEWLKARWAEAVIAMRTGEGRRLLDALSGPLTALVLAIVAVIGLRAARARRRRPRTAAAPSPWNADPDLAAVLARLEALWARHGCARPPHRPPLEHLRRLPSGRLPPALAAASADVIATYYAARYGGRPLAREAVRELSARLEGTP